MKVDNFSLQTRGISFWVLNGTVISNETNAQGDSSTIMDADGNIWVAWEDFRQDDGDIYVQKISENGKNEFQMNSIPVHNDSNKSDYSRVIIDGQGGIIIVWHDNRTGMNEIYMQRIDSSGNKMWNSEGYRVSNKSSLKEYPQIINCSDGNFVIFWEDNRTSNKDIYAQKFDLNGNYLWTENGSSICNATSDQQFYITKIKAVTSTKNNELIITWRDKRKN